MSLSYQRIEGSLMFYFSPYEFNALNKVNVKILDEIDVRIEFQAHLNQWECNVTETLSDIEVINYGFEEIGMYGLSILID